VHQRARERSQPHGEQRGQEGQIGVYRAAREKLGGVIVRACTVTCSCYCPMCYIHVLYTVT
jgi:hypothetical protein